MRKASGQKEQKEPDIPLHKKELEQKRRKK
jgi:hypothetical protein